MHPLHSHGYAMKIVARDGYPARAAPRIDADTVGVSPGERWDAMITAERPRRVGVPLPHPPPRRGLGRHVRHGQHADRRAQEGRRRRDRPGARRRLMPTMTALHRDGRTIRRAPACVRPTRDGRCSRRTSPTSESGRRPTRRSTSPGRSARGCWRCRSSTRAPCCCPAAGSRRGSTRSASGRERVAQALVERGRTGRGGRVPRLDGRPGRGDRRGGRGRERGHGRRRQSRPRHGGPLPPRQRLGACRPQRALPGPGGPLGRACPELTLG